MSVVSERLRKIHFPSFGANKNFSFSYYGTPDFFRKRKHKREGLIRQVIKNVEFYDNSNATIMVPLVVSDYQKTFSMSLISSTDHLHCFVWSISVQSNFSFRLTWGITGYVFLFEQKSNFHSFTWILNDFTTFLITLNGD